MTAAVGERVTARYIKHAPPGTTSPLANGRTYDAGIAQIMDSNVSHLTSESMRHLVSCSGFSVATVASSSKLFEGIQDWSGHASGFLQHADIPWDRRTAVRLGPFALVQDEIATTGESVPRIIRVQVDLSNAGSTLAMYYALTLSPSSEAVYLSGGIDVDNTANGCIKHTAVTTTTAEIATLTPRVHLGPSSSQPWKSRRASSTATGTTYVIPAWLWVGFAAINGTVWINAINAWEKR